MNSVISACITAEHHYLWVCWGGALSCCKTYVDPTFRRTNVSILLFQQYIPIKTTIDFHTGFSKNSYQNESFETAKQSCIDSIGNLDRCSRRWAHGVSWHTWTLSFQV